MVWYSQQITSRQLYFLLTVAMFPSEILLLPGPLIRTLGKDALWAVLISGVLAGVPLLMGLAILRSAPDGSMITVAQRVFGRAGPVVLLAIAVPILVATVNIWGSYVQLLRVDLLNRTSPAILLLLGMVAVAYALQGGLEVAGRTGEVLGASGIFMWIVLVGLAGTWFNFDNLLPALPSPGRPLATGIYQAFAFQGEIAWVGLLGAFVRERQSIARTAVFAWLTNLFILLSSVAVPLLMFGPGHAGILVLPTLSAIRSIHYGFTIERLDTFLVPLMVGLIALKLIIWGLVSAHLIDGAFSGRVHASLTAPILMAATGLTSLTLHSLSRVHASVGMLWYDTGAPVMAAALVLLTLGSLASRRRVTGHA